MTLMGCLLMVQAVGIFGSMFLSRLAGKFGTKTIVLCSLVIWSGIAFYGYLMTKPIEFWILGALVGLVLGGSQALSRSLYSKIIPAHASAEFFGFFSVFEKFSAIWGPIVFAVVRQTTGNARNSILSLIGFFIIGFALLLFVNMNKAKTESEALEQALLKERDEE
jgi:UMF1 family MFS transporter